VQAAFVRQLLELAQSVSHGTFVRAHDAAPGRQRCARDCDADFPCKWLKRRRLDHDVGGTRCNKFSGGYRWTLRSLGVRVTQSLPKVHSSGARHRAKSRRTDPRHDEIETKLVDEAIMLVKDHLRERSPGLAESDKTEAELAHLHLERRLDEKTKLLNAALDFPVSVVVHEAYAQHALLEIEAEVFDDILRIEVAIPRVDTLRSEGTSE
jgi:hypothetical protein